MTDDEVKIHYDAMVKMFGIGLPSPIHEPKRFAYYVKMYWYALDQQMRKDKNESGIVN